MRLLFGKILLKISYRARYGSLLFSDCLIFLSHSHLKRVLLDAKDLISKSVVVPMPPALEAPVHIDLQNRMIIRKQFGIDSETTAIIFFGYFYEGKGVENLIESVNLLHQDGYKIKVLFVGKEIGYEVGGYKSRDYMLKLKQMIKNYGLEDLFIWRGFLSPKEVFETIFCADMSVFPFKEGLDINNSSYATISIRGLPVIASKMEGFNEELFIDSENILLFRTNDVNDLTEKIKFLINNKDKRDQLGRNSQEFFKKILNWENVVLKTVEALRL